MPRFSGATGDWLEAFPAKRNARDTRRPVATPPQPPTEPPKAAPKGTDRPKVNNAQGRPQRAPTQPPAMMPRAPQAQQRRRLEQAAELRGLPPDPAPCIVMRAPDRHP
eukprot:CAMPEP_0181541664 /NCGR_PEP_ID=MMETSP1110-20121109/77518_1 /TAXON_ID=174948 /ORGANISM="Symbiodinium sp., Strain CCMP421" /LENGTH=107 /DNA_ID=CAMNT_0023673343 /DNA_START=47 /DNA_END=370 /DNA_ORIENTATION=+